MPAPKNQKRGLSVDIAILEKLQGSDEFRRYLEILQDGIDAGMRSLRAGIASTEEIRDHNVTVGIIQGLERAHDLVDNHLRELEQDLQSQNATTMKEEKPMPMDAMNGETVSR